jgi:hypothetical protein
MDRYGKPIYPAIEVILIIKPDFCVRICGNSLHHFNRSEEVSLKVILISSEGISSNGPVIPTPALLIISNLPELAMIFSTAA